jgi:hypothetical protein
MDHEMKVPGIRFICLLLATPIMGWIVLICAEKFEKSWKTNNRRKKWLACCGLFMLLAAISGWLR